MATYTNKEISDALVQCRGMVYVAAKKLGCDPKTIKKRIKDVPEVAEIKDAQREFVKDLGELKLLQAVERGDPWAIQFLLKMLAKDRGYSEKTDVNISGSLVIPFMPRRGDLELESDSEA